MPRAASSAKRSASRRGRSSEIGHFYNSPGFTDERTTCFLAEGLARDRTRQRRHRRGAHDGRVDRTRRRLAPREERRARSTRRRCSRSPSPSTSSPAPRPRSSVARRTAPLSIDAEEYLTYLAIERGRAANSISSYRHDLAGYEEFLAERGDGAPRRHAEGARGVPRHAPRAPGSRRRREPERSSRSGGCTASVSTSAACRRDPTRGRRAPEHPEERPEGAERGGDRARARCGRRRVIRARFETGRSSSCSTRADCGSPSSSACRSPISTSTTGCCGPSARARRSASCPSAGPRPRRSASGSAAPGGRCSSRRSSRRRDDAEALFLSLRGRRMTRQAAWTVVRQAAEAVGLETGHAARVAPQLRHASPRPRRRHPRRPGAARPRLDHDDADLHQGLPGAPAPRLSRRPPASELPDGGRPVGLAETHATEENDEHLRRAASDPGRRAGDRSRTTPARCSSIVNVASKCGLTPQYETLEELQKTYADQGFSRARLPLQPVRWPRARQRRGDRRPSARRPTA